MLRLSARRELFGQVWTSSLKTAFLWSDAATALTRSGAKGESSGWAAEAVPSF